jgi:hypothetical protein
MARLLIRVEGVTEEAFANEVLARHLHEFGYESVGARLVGNARQRERRGGIPGWNVVRTGIINHLRSDTGCLATTMVDYYGLPQKGAKAWPGRAAAGKVPFPRKGATVEDALNADVGKRLGNRINKNRFIAFVMMHEFEGMLFSDCERFAVGIGRPDLGDALQAIRDAFAIPEEINDSPQTQPAQRVENLVADYQKPLHGNLAALAIGLDGLRTECPHFDEWLQKLEAWPKLRTARPKGAPSG